MAEYWRELLSGIEPCRFPTLNDRDDLAGETGLSEVLLYEASQLMSLCEREGILPFAVFQTAWAVVLRSYIHSDSVCFASFVSGQDSAVGGNPDATSPFSGLLICSTLLTEGLVVERLSEMQAKLDHGMPFMVQYSAEISRVLNFPANELFNTGLSINSPASHTQTTFSPDNGKDIEVSDYSQRLSIVQELSPD